MEESECGDVSDTNGEIDLGHRMVVVEAPPVEGAYQRTLELAYLHKLSGKGRESCLAQKWTSKKGHFARQPVWVPVPNFTMRTE